MTDLDKFNEYIIKLANFKGVGIRKKIVNLKRFLKEIAK